MRDNAIKRKQDTKTEQKKTSEQAEGRVNINKHLSQKHIL